MATPYMSEKLEREENKQVNNQSLKPGFQVLQYFDYSVEGAQPVLRNILNSRTFTTERILSYFLIRRLEISS